MDENLITVPQKKNGNITCTTIPRYPICNTRCSVMCKVYTGYHGTSEIEHGLCACTVDNPRAKASGDYLSVQAHKPCSISHILFLKGINMKQFSTREKLSVISSSIPSLYSIFLCNFYNTLCEVLAEKDAKIYRA